MESLIVPVLLELNFARNDRISFFSGIEFTIDPAAGLSGRRDFLLARNPGQLDLNSPVCVVVEAKNEEVLAGIPQALPEMVAARQCNEQAGPPIDPIVGVFRRRGISDPMTWADLRDLDGDRVERLS